jgi:hypothetical protein
MFLKQLKAKKIRRIAVLLASTTISNMNQSPIPSQINVNSHIKGWLTFITILNISNYKHDKKKKKSEEIN